MDDEDKIMQLIMASNTNFHPMIKESRLPTKYKLILQELLENEFNNDFNALLEDMMHYAVGEELYELAVVIRDFLNEDQ